VTQIDFYTHVENKQQTACRLAAKAMRQGMRVMLFAPDANATDQLSRLLWTFPATGFVPHCRSADDLAQVTPVIVDHLVDVLVHDEMLINLHPEWPPFFSRFQRLVEIVSTEEEDRRQARLRFRFYRDRGYDIQHHDLRGDAAMAP
jgi:DNA polymerase III subunit chi